MIRILIAEDQAMVRGALSALLGLEPDLEVVAEVGRGDEILSAALSTRPDVALLDIELPGIDGLTAAGQLHEQIPDCRVILLTIFGRPGYLRTAMERGAAGFLLKDAPSPQLAEAIRRAVRGLRTVDPELAVAALSERPSLLSAREQEILLAADEHATIREIAAHVYLSEGTVRNHLSAAIQKVGARNRGEALRIARERGWLDPRSR